MQIKGAKGNKPIPIKDEHDLSRIFLPEYFTRDGDCSISKIYPAGILMILRNVSCFPDAVRKLAKNVLYVRHQLLHTAIDQWDDAMHKDAFAIRGCANIT